MRNKSKPNKIFAELLEQNNMKFDREFRLGNFIYDFKINNILIEINPTATHNSYKSFIKQKQPLSITYHKDKSDNAELYGYICIHVFDKK